MLAQNAEMVSGASVVRNYLRNVDAQERDVEQLAVLLLSPQVVLSGFNFAPRSMTDEQKKLVNGAIAFMAIVQSEGGRNGN